VQVEAQLRLETLPHGFEQAAFRRRQAEGIAFDVDPLGVAALESLHAVRVQHGDHQQRQALEHALHACVLPMDQQVVGQIQQRGRRRRLVTVHL